MPSQSPKTVARRFQKRVTDVLRDTDELLLAVHAKHRQASLETMIAEQSVMLTTVLWETFISDLVISYVLTNPRPCFDNYEGRFRQSLVEKFAGISRWVSLDFPAIVNPAQAEKLLDPKGWNVTAGSAQKLSDLANRHLTAANARKFSLQADDRDFVDYLVSLRNYLSHRSPGSRTMFLNSVAALAAGGANGALKGQVQNVGTYLKQQVAPNARRVT
jgi:hypothetical protein